MVGDCSFGLLFSKFSRFEIRISMSHLEDFDFKESGLKPLLWPGITLFYGSRNCS